MNRLLKTLTIAAMGLAGTHALADIQNHLTVHHSLSATQQHIAQFCADAGGGIAAQSANGLTCEVDAGSLVVTMRYVFTSASGSSTNVTWNVTARAVGMGGVAGAQDLVNSIAATSTQTIYGDLQAWK